VFDNYQIPLDKPDHNMALTVGALWTNFAKTGSPNAPARTGGGGEELVWWPTYNASSDLHLEIATPLSVGSNHRREQCEFWDSLPRQDGYPSY
jgi:carboxylesterase type B